MSEANTDKILERLLNEPKEVSVDNQVVKNPDISDVIELAKYQASKAATRKKQFPLRVYRMSAGGAAR